MEIKTCYDTNYFDIIKNVYQKFEDLLRNKLIFKLKNTLLNISVYEKKEGNTMGVCMEEEAGHTFSYKINLLINPKDSKKYIAFVIAHEFAHLYFANFMDPLKLTGTSKDETTNFSAIRRLLPDGTVYGTALEEMCADYVAKYVVSYLDFEDENKQYATMCKKETKKFEFIESLTKIFGDSIYETKYIDAYFSTSDSFIMQNKFWYYISTLSFSEIINEYDDYMGESAFRILNQEITKFYDFNDSNSQKFIFSELERFKMLLSITF